MKAMGEVNSYLSVQHAQLFESNAEKGINNMGESIIVETLYTIAYIEHMEYC